MTKAIKAQALLAANPDMPNKDFVKLLMSELGMTINGARTYAYNARNPKDEAKVAKVKTKAAKVIKAAKATKQIEKSVDDIAAIKAKNLATMRKVSSKLKPFREQLDEVIKDREPGFDPQLARDEVQAILEGEGFVAKPSKTHD